jgi:hypothetical protein
VEPARGAFEECSFSLGRAAGTATGCWTGQPQPDAVELSRGNDYYT